MVAYSELIPVFVLTGFLGSGKTSLLNHMLRHPSLRDAAVLINEFGQVGIDHLLVQRVDESTVVLDSGCLCCTIRDDLKASILSLHDQRARGEVPRFQRMIIETTGLADPAPILHTLLADRALSNHYRLATVIATVDAVNAAAQLDRQEEAVKQIAMADRVVLTKRDIARPADVTALRREIARINPSADIVEALFGNTDIDRLLQADVYDPATRNAELWRTLQVDAPSTHDHGHASRHGANINAFCVVHDAPIDWTAFGIWLTMLLHNHGEDVLRVKGVLNVKGVATPVAISGAQHVVHPPVHLDSWLGDDRRSRIVFIVRDLAPDRIEESLAEFNRIAGVSPGARLP